MNTPLPLLETKLFLPTLRANSVARPRLISRLEEALPGERQVILLSAGAGFGKTTLLTEWCHAQAARTPETPQVAWLSLDENDNDPVRFWSYVIAALRTLLPNVGSAALALAQTPSTDVRVLVATLVNELAGFDQQTILVLEDYHRLTAQPIHDGLTFLLDHLPLNFFVVLNTRSDPPLPLGRYRALGKLLELRTDDLSFTAEEASEFLNGTMGLNLTVMQVQALRARTEGWIAGLQLAALAVQARQTGDDAEATLAFIGAFTGSHRFVMDYLVDEVLGQQKQRLENFLLQTCILERFNAALCNAVTLAEDGQENLERLERSNLFMISLDDSREWYRYHHLFAELLQHRLQTRHARLVPELHRRAAEWFARNEYWQEATGHALAAKDYESAAHYVEQQLDRIFRSGEMVTLAKWIAALPEQVLDEHPRLYYARARTRLAVNRLDACEQDLARAGELLEDAKLEVPDARVLCGEIAVTWAYLGFLKGDMKTAYSWSERALADLPEKNYAARAELALWRGAIHMGENNFEDAVASYRQAQALAELDGNAQTALRALVNVGAIEHSRGHLYVTLRVLTEGLRRVHDPAMAGSVAGRLLYFVLNELYYEWNQLEEALEYARQGAHQIESLHDPRLQVHAANLLGITLVAMGETEQAQVLIEKALQKVEQFQVPLFYSSVTQAAQVRIWIANRQLDAAERWARGVEPLLQEPLNNSRLLIVGGYARVLLALGESTRLEGLLERALMCAAETENVNMEIPTLLQLSRVARERGDAAKADAYCQRALALGEPGGMIRAFVDEGEPVRQMLAGLHAKLKPTGVEDNAVSRLAGYAEKLIAAFAPPRSPGEARMSRRGETADTLTGRELQVLRLVAKGWSNQQIADELVVTLSAIKKHTGTILQKLDVSNRTEAVARGRELGLIG